MLLRLAQRFCRHESNLCRRQFTSASEAAGGKPKSMLDGGAPGLNPSSSLLGQAAEAQMQKIKVDMEAQGHPAAAQSSTLVRKLFRFVGDLMLVGTVGIGGASAYYYYRYDLKEMKQILEEEKGKDSLVSQLWCSAMKYYVDFRQKAESMVRTYADPTYDKLLPDMAPELKGRIKTLVLDLDDLLIHKEWTRQKGWTIYKRPGVQDFIFELGQYFEIVIFTDEPNTYADPIINRLDTQRVIPFRLYRPETQYHEGRHVRDLSKLNREMSQVLMISAKPEAWEYQPENTIKLKPWHNDPKDTMLLDLIPFLQMIAMKGVKDVRDVVQSYDGEDNIPLAFKTRMQHISEQTKQHHPRGLFGLKPSL